MENENGLCFGIVYWRPSDEISIRVAGILERFGQEAITILPEERLPTGLDVVLVWGPILSLVPFAKQVAAAPPSQRPLFALWLTEQLSDPALPEWVRYPLSIARSRTEWWAFREQDSGEWQLRARLGWLTTKGHRFRYYGDLHLLQRMGILAVLAVGSRWIAGFLRARGFNPLIAYIGSHPDWWANLDLERDVPVLWIGKTATGRRERVLKRIRKELRRRGVDVLMIDEKENPAVFGDKRTVLLNRTKIVLNILRTPWDNHSLRFFLAAPNRALVVSEPTFSHIPFEPGVHYLEAPIDEMADKICHYLSHEQERHEIVERAFQLATTDLTMERAVDSIVRQVTLVRQKRYRLYPAEVPTGETMKGLV